MATLNEYTVLDPSIETAWGTNKCHMRPIPLLDKTFLEFLLNLTNHKLRQVWKTPFWEANFLFN
ncbi:MAG: hypothetical protein ACI808_000464 [Paraglaciecola sp.]|jgi:hypothetical protein